MKKIAAFFVLSLFIWGCVKEFDQKSSSDLLLSKIDDIGQKSENELQNLVKDFQLNKNEFDFIGNQIFKSLSQLECIIRDSKTKVENADSILYSLLVSSVSAEYLKLDDKNFNQTESLIFEKIASSLLDSEPGCVSLKISFFEDAISGSDALSTESKTRLLVFCTVYKYSFEYLTNLSGDTKNGEFDDCFRAKMDAIFNTSGFLKKLHCVVDWPVCLSIAAADCAIEILSD